MGLYTTLLVVLVLGKIQGIDTADNCFEMSPDSEDCDNGCILGYHGDHCDLPCPRNCRGYKKDQPACSQDNGYCLNGCKTGWYGDQCDQMCPVNCENNTCDRVTGNCIRCKEGLFGIHCQEECSVNCEENCARDGSCKCKQGFAGRACEHECSNNCLDKRCQLKTDEGDTRICSTGCIIGFTGPYCQKLCPVECLKCNQNGSCEADKHEPRRKREESSRCLHYSASSSQCECCRTGWMGINCSERCLNCVQRFVKDDGVCIKGCSNATFGDSCEKLCSANCTTGPCDKTTGHCNGCKQTKFGDHCEKECDRRCNSSGCCQNTGLCISCPPDRYGPYCQKPCNIGCIDGKCNGTTGHCTCKEGWVGHRCEVKIPRGCESVDTVITKSGNHECVGRCKNGYCGDDCKAHCPRCPNGCPKHNGTCLPQYKKVDHILNDAVVGGVVPMSIFFAVVIAELVLVLYLLRKISQRLQKPTKEAIPLRSQ